MNKVTLSLQSFVFFFLLIPVLGQAQKSSAEIYAQIKKLQVVGSVLYFAAHPDDENNAFLPYLTKERNYRTAYLSLTRGDGGQNLIGKEQGIELGMIRTQELLAARKIDGAEQYFSTAYEFGFSKSSEEALRIWDHEKVLSDAVWVIRKFQPDIIITRFPTDARAGHGHHSASAIIANEAYVAAADPTRFPEQFKWGVSPWKAKRILWNTFNFGTVNTTNEQQIKMEVGGFNPVIGKSYGEVGADARTMHKSQGEGRPGRRGRSFEYFETTGGEKPTTDIMDGVNTSWSRLGAANIQQQIDEILQQFQVTQPAASIPALVALYQTMQALPSSIWKQYKMDELQSIIQACTGLFMEASTPQAQVVPGANLQMQFWLNCRSNSNAVLQKISLPFKDSVVQTKLVNNQNIQFNYNFTIPANTPISQPYWLVQPKTEGMFIVNEQQLIGKAQNDPVFSVGVQIAIAGQVFNYVLPVQYKYLDPTKGDQYQPLVVVPEQETKFEQDVYLIKKEGPFKVAYQNIHHLGKSERVVAQMSSSKDDLPQSHGAVYTKTIQYDHIPTLTYFPTATAKIVVADVKIKGTKVGYIDGAGDKLPEALIALGYELVPLKESDLVLDKIKSLDAIVIGVRAYNMFAYLTDKNEVMNQYIEQGGNLIVQYLKSNQVGLRPVKVGPYAFSVNAGKRVTQEEAPVTFNLPEHSVLNYPNKITSNDFMDWVQERSTYQADSFDSHFAAPFTMNDKGEAPSNGSLLIAPYGKGNMVYLSLVLFRQLPAGNAGAYKLLANIVSLPKH
jgi:LmbE family N-acetylglucosaminyl deacetylase